MSPGLARTLKAVISTPYENLMAEVCGFFIFIWRR